jgi:hypothetical protein
LVSDNAALTPKANANGSAIGITSKSPYWKRISPPLQSACRSFRATPCGRCLPAHERNELEKPHFGVRSDNNWLVEIQDLQTIHDDHNTSALERLHSR